MSTNGLRIVNNVNRQKLRASTMSTISFLMLTRL
nr:MAG TPA: hypothetical protein [Caudoviricetes sp.]